MEKYRCNKCDRKSPCFFVCDGYRSRPQRCPYYNEYKTNWINVKESKGEK
jgi:hypothetical protein